MAKAKAKSSSKSKIDIKTFLLEKGEKIGLAVAGVGLLSLALFGVLAATSAASPSQLSNELKTGTTTIDNRLVATPDLKPEKQEITEKVTFREVKVTEFLTPNEHFDISDVVSDKRVNPQIVGPENGQVIFALGGIGVYLIEGEFIGVIEGRSATGNNIRQIRVKVPKGGQPKAAPPPVAPPPAAPPPGGAPPGAGGRGGFAGNTPGGERPGRPGATTGRPPAESEVVLKKIDSKEVESAELAINLRPERMAVIRAVIPYKKQVEKYLQALRLPDDAALEGDKSAPTYRGFSVERQVLSADGKTVITDWKPFDHLAAIHDLYRITAAFESESEFADFIPDKIHQLYLKRPKMEHGTYALQSMPELLKALEEVKKATNAPRVLTGPAKKVLGGENPFDLQDATPSAPGAAPGGGPPGVIPPGAPGALAPPGGVRPGGGRGDNIGGRGGPGATTVRNNTMPVWLLQFIDPTIETGYSYKYRIQLKLQNPNHGRDKSHLAFPGLANVEELLSEWFEIPGSVVAPPEEYIYAHSERHPDLTTYGGGGYDTTTLRFHRWTDYVRVTRDNSMPDPVAEWVCVDLDGKRGQYIHQDRAIKMPLWSMVAKNYIFRDRISPTGKAMSLRELIKRENVKVDFTPRMPTLLVDFDGGKGSYRLPNGMAVTDDCMGEILLLTDDGKVLVTTARNTAADQIEKKPREEAWARWLEEVVRNTEAQAGGANPPRGP